MKRPFYYTMTAEQMAKALKQASTVITRDDAAKLQAKFKKKYPGAFVHVAP